MFDRRYFKFEIVFFVFIFFTISAISQDVRLRTQDDTVRAPNVGSVPTIDGHSDDSCWGLVEWQEIDQVWIPWNGSVGAGDYTGQYKVVWSSVENLLYFVVEVTDDVFIDGYVFPNGGYHNFDVVELFIDEDKSGGLHRIDQGSENAENAFAYHIMVDAPADGDTTTDFVVCDNAGFWEIVDRAGHFPDLAMRKNGDQYIWEFSLAVYADTFDSGDPEASRVDLTEGKIMGLSMAYCDNDAPDGVRDNFFGSVEVAHADSNNHWINADGFGTLELVGESGIEDELVNSEISFISYPNPFQDKTIIEFELAGSSKVKIDVLNVLGQSVAKVTEARFKAGRHTVEWTSEGIPAGIYFCRMEANSFKSIKRLLIIK
jgi:hypothetical protein